MLALVSSLAAAQGNRPSGSNASTDAMVGLEEIVVTARKRTENLQEVPISIVAVSQEQIERRNLTDLADLAKSTVGFTWSEGLSPADARPAIRGQANIRTSSQPTVGVFVDGNSVTWRSGLNLQTIDVSRIEVVKGPQSALFGRGVLSGAVNYVTRRPESQFGGYAEALYGSDGRVDLRGRLDLPASDTLSLAVSGRWSEFDGYFKNALTGRDTGMEEANSGSIALLWEPSSEFTAYARASYSSEWQSQPARHVVPSNTQTGTLPAQVWFIGELPVDPSLISHNCDECGGMDRDVTWVTLNLDWQVRGGTFTSMSAFNDADFLSDYDTDFTGILPSELPIHPVFRNSFRNYRDRNIRSFGQELRFASAQEARLRWLAGAYYYDEKVVDDARSLTGTTAPPSSVPSQPQRNDVTSMSAFGALTFDLTDRLTAGAEIRWNEDDARVDFLLSGVPRSLSNKWESWLPRFTLDFQWTPELMIYANAAKGSKPGGFNTAIGAGVGGAQLPESLIAYDEESAWSYEIGMKSQLLDRRLTLNIAAFHIDWSDMQVDSQYFPPPPAVGQVGYTSNAGKAEVTGGEIEVRWQATDALEVAAAYAFTPSRIFDYQLSQATVAGISTLGERNLPYTSDHSALASITYTAPLAGDWTWFGQLDGQFRGTQYATIANLAETGDRTLVDLRLGLNSQTWQFTAFVTNLFDDDTAESISPFLNPQTGARNFIVSVPDPRQWGLRVRYSF